MTVKRKPLKPVKGWVVVGPENRIVTFGDIYATKAGAWRMFMTWCSAGTSFDGKSRAEMQLLGYRAIPVVVMERGKK